MCDVIMYLIIVSIEAPVIVKCRFISPHVLRSYKIVFVISDMGIYVLTASGDKRQNVAPQNLRQLSQNDVPFVPLTSYSRHLAQAARLPLHSEKSVRI